MMKLITKGTYNTSWGTAFVIDYTSQLKIGDSILVEDKKYVIKKIILPTKPSELHLMAILV